MQEMMCKKKRMEIYMEVLEYMISMYYENSIIIITCCCILFLLGIYFTFRLVKDNKRYVINEIVQNCLNVFIIVTIGGCFYLLGLVPRITNVNINALFFIIVFSLIIVYGIIQLIIFHKIPITILQILKNVVYLLFFEVFLLTITNHLSYYEFLTVLLAITFIIISSMLIREMDKNNEDETISAETDYPNSKLFPTRERQLKSFISILEKQKDEPYAIMISGEWGIGKTSFVKALESNMKKDVFIWVKAGSEKSVLNIMRDLSDNLIRILKKNNILVEKDNLIENYFMAFSELCEKEKFKFISHFPFVLSTDNVKDDINYLNKKLKELNKTIYLIIDDLDRCDKEYQKIMFKVIRESTNLKNCKTIFLIDKDKFYLGDHDYLEKYISYHLELCKVEYNEIFHYFIDIIFNNDFIEKMNPLLKKGKSQEEIKKIIYYIPDEILKICGPTFKDILISKDNKSDKEKDNTNIDLKEIETIQIEIKKNIINARKVKRCLKGIKQVITNLNREIENVSSTMQQEDWLETVVRIQFIKFILPSYYDEMKKHDSVFECSNIILINLLDIEEVPFNDRINKKKVIDVVNKVDVIDFSQIMTEREKYLGELHSDKASIKNINQYLDYFTTKDDLIRILDICESQKFTNFNDDIQFAMALLKKISNQSKLSYLDTDGLYDLSFRIIDFLKGIDLSKSDIEAFDHYGYKILRFILVNNSQFLMSILLVFFNVDKVESLWDLLNVTTVDELYDMLIEIDDELENDCLDNENEKLEKIRNKYIEYLEKLQAKEYEDLDIDLSKLYNRLDDIFETCNLWLNINKTLSASKSENVGCSELHRLFLDNQTYINIAAFEEELSLLNKFYKTKEGCYKSEFSQLLLIILLRVVKKYQEDYTWFAGREIKICNQLSEMSEFVCELDKQEDKIAEEVIMRLKILVFRLQNYCKIDKNESKN